MFLRAPKNMQLATGPNPVLTALQADMPAAGLARVAGTGEWRQCSRAFARIEPASASRLLAKTAG